MDYAGIYEYKLVIVSLIIAIIATYAVFKMMVRMAELEYKKENSLQESLALRRTIIDSLPISLIVIDQNQRIADINQPCRSLFQIKDPIKEIIGKSVFMYFDDIYKNSRMEIKKIAEVMIDQRPYVDEMELITGRMINRSYIPFFMDQELKGHLWTFEDITERKQMERANLEAMEAAEQASEEKTRFLSHISHELRTPLNGILGFAQLLESEETLSPKQKEFVNIILKGGRHLMMLIKDILDISRIEEGQINIVKETVNVGALLEECVQFMGPYADERGIRILKEWEQTEESTVLADPKRMKQILLNLLDNAIKYNRENGVVKVQVNDTKGFVYVHVMDSGMGIPDSKLEVIFEPFYRVGKSKVDGAGLGLALARQLIEAMGGEMGVASRINTGSDFWMKLPLAPRPAASAEIVQAESNKSFPKDDSYIILYIEDNILNVQLVEELIGTIEGISLISAQTGLEGLAMVKNHSPDLILLDIYLPDFDGFEVLKRIKEDHDHEQIPVIALSANAVQGEIDRALAAGFTEYICKPIDGPIFLSIIAKRLSAEEECKESPLSAK